MSDLNEWLKSLSDDELQQRIDIAFDDTNEAAEIEKESDDHLTCFAGLMTLVFEARNRGLHLKRMH